MLDPIKVNDVVDGGGRLYAAICVMNSMAGMLGKSPVDKGVLFGQLCTCVGFGFFDLAMISGKSEVESSEAANAMLEGLQELMVKHVGALGIPVEGIVLPTREHGSSN